MLTNAHVVAGVDRPQVQVGGTGSRLDARVVALRPRAATSRSSTCRTCRRPRWTSTPRPAAATRRCVAGYPGGGPFRLGAARVRDTLNARGADIYHRTQTTREVFSLYADVEPGNSGGPLLSLKGDVYGVIFAKSLDDPRTGYALTVDEARPVVKAGRNATAEVGTDTCA